MIDQILLYTAAVPMSRSFRHAGAARTATETVLLRVDAGGATGWGEGAPRSYVTGESAGSAAANLAAVPVQRLDELTDWSSPEAMVRALGGLDLAALVGRGQPAPSAAAALETALLDAAARLHDRSLTEVFRAEFGGRRRWPQSWPVTLVIDLDQDVRKVLEQLPQTTLDALEHVKLKVDADAEDGVARVRAAAELLGPGCTVSADANCAWPQEQATQLGAALTAAGAAWIEEPTAPRAWWTLRSLAAARVPVMLDESLLTARDLGLAARIGAATHVNLRISKCGGPLAVARLAAQARDAGLAFQLGVQVGEVGPLWAAGRALAAALEGPVAVEAGRQDEWFPEPLTEPAYTIDRVGYRAAPPIGPGTGVSPSAELLAHCKPYARWSPQDRWQEVS
ncbi:MAG TPA: enolase C-terminal domain-like protein [Actinocrinis sp.]|nr:enolase C-terminal domain-like protein [Actinocrinis sp.]